MFEIWPEATRPKTGSGLRNSVLPRGAKTQHHCYKSNFLTQLTLAILWSSMKPDTVERLINSYAIFYDQAVLRLGLFRVERSQHFRLTPLNLEVVHAGCVVTKLILFRISNVRPDTNIL